MSEIIVETTPMETIIEIEGGPVLTTTVNQEVQTVIETPAEPVVIDLNSGARGEPGSAILTGPAYPTLLMGSVGDLFIVTEGNVGAGDVYTKTSLGWVKDGNIRGPAGGVNVVNGEYGPVVELTPLHLGLERVNNTNDAEKPISAAVQAALDEQRAISAIKAADNEVVKLFGDQTIEGIKTFVESPVVPDAAFPINKIANLQSSLDEKVGLFGDETISGIKTFSGALYAEAGINTLAVNAGSVVSNEWMKVGHTDGTASAPRIDFYAGAIVTDYDARIAVENGTGTMGEGRMVFTAGQFVFSSAAPIIGNGSELTDLDASNVSSGILSDDRLSDNVSLLDANETYTGNKTFVGAVIVPTPVAENHAATKGYVDSIVDAAPGTLDTLNELAAALGDDPNFATTVTNQIATKEPIINAGTTAQYWRGDKTWQTLSGAAVDLSSSQVIGGEKRFSDLLIVGTGTSAPSVPVGGTSSISPSFASTATSGAAAVSVAVLDGTNYKRAWFFMDHTNGKWGLSSTYSSGSHIPFVIKFASTEAMTLNSSGTLTATLFSGSGASLTNLNASNLTTGEISSSLLPVRLRTTAATVTDWNNVVTNGFYMASGAANAPDASWWVGTVWARDPNYVVQQIHPFTSATYQSGSLSTQQARRRVQVNGVWGPWHKIIDTEEAHDTRNNATYQRLNYTDGGVKVARDVVRASFLTTAINRYVRINTNIPITSANMIKIHVKIFNYTLGVVDGWFSGYMYNNAGGTIHSPAWVNSGDYMPVVTPAEDANGNLVLVFDGSWKYLRVNVDEVEAAGATMSNAHTEGWTVTHVTSLTGLTTTALWNNTEHGKATVRAWHGNNAAYARPVGAYAVEWIGSVSPTNATSNDTWVNTSV